LSVLPNGLRLRVGIQCFALRSPGSVVRQDQSERISYKLALSIFRILGSFALSGDENKTNHLRSMTGSDAFHNPQNQDRIGHRIGHRPRFVDHI
jgi:hypothetical protein